MKRVFLASALTLAVGILGGGCAAAEETDVAAIQKEASAQVPQDLKKPTQEQVQQGLHIPKKGSR